ncbi:hypothetical protein DL98DRAFT_610041 [Cadophora sp. DSE1049]|nr:hypothetical protein DL98DRAFT_610041 [Cadophora sp. DSE1049]
MGLPANTLPLPLEAKLMTRTGFGESYSHTPLVETQKIPTVPKQLPYSSTSAPTSIDRLKAEQFATTSPASGSDVLQKRPSQTVTAMPSIVSAILTLQQPAGSTQPGQVIRFNATIDTIRISSSSLFMLRDFCSPRLDTYPMYNTTGLNLYNEGPPIAERRARLIRFNVIQNLDVFEIARFNTRGVTFLQNHIMTAVVQLRNVAPNLRPGLNNSALSLTRNRMNAELDALRRLAGPGGPLEDVVGVLLPLIVDMRSKRLLAIGMFFL